MTISIGLRALRMVALLSLVSVVLLPSGAAGQSVTCLAPIDSLARARMQNLKVSMRMTSDPAVQASFASLQIPVQSDTSQVVWLTDNRICQKILPKYNARLTQVGASRPAATQLYVMKVGTSFVASDTYTSTAQDWRTQMVLNKQYAVLAAFGS